MDLQISLGAPPPPATNKEAGTMCFFWQSPQLKVGPQVPWTENPEPHSYFENPQTLQPKGSQKSGYYAKMFGV